ncbi:IS630 family transposase [Streptomyces viridochromogenes DSM 40736]|uniref:IS630 family transposase n=1 Tax=Streptomyces viridochromogenes (strain DSM 40736 / JCM 4977 / BCRC 1201 / Tue 494) TaxID=591159 RepID=D9XHP9_STRVT|nr:IS630 family transposase [Streptomyces viridochromogenes DSM 40736]
MAAGKRTAADLGAHICFEDEAGQGLRPPKGHTWAPRGARPVVRVRGRNRGRVNTAGVVCYRAGHRSRFFFKLHIWHGRRGEPKAFSWRQYRDLIVMTHLQLGTPVVWCWDNLNVHLVKELADFAEEHKDWLQIFQMPSYAPELNPAEGIWSLLKRQLADFAAADLTHLTRVIKRKLKKIQYRPHLVDGCLPPTGLTIGCSRVGVSCGVPAL